MAEASAVEVAGAAAGDILEIEILDIVPRPSQAPEFAGRCFGSNGTVWWGYHYKELLSEPRPRKVMTLYELVRDDGALYAQALYNFRWTPQRDPFGAAPDNRLPRRAGRSCDDY